MLVKLLMFLKSLRLVIVFKVGQDLNSSVPDIE